MVTDTLHFVFIFTLFGVSCRDNFFFRLDSLQEKMGIDHLPTVKHVFCSQHPNGFCLSIVHIYIYMCAYIYNYISALCIYIYISHIYIHLEYIYIYIYLYICDLYMYSIYTFWGELHLVSCLLCSNESYDELIVFYFESKHFMLFESSCIHFAAQRKNSRSLWVILDGS